MKDTTRMSVPLLRQLIMSAMFLASTLSVWAQAGNHVTGNVTDVTGEPMTGVSVVEKGSKEELELRMRLLGVGEEEEKKAAESSGEDVFLIEQKYVRKRQELNERFASERNKKLEEEYASKAVLINAAMAKELDEIAELYRIGEMNTETYEKRKSEISQKYCLLYTSPSPRD